MWRSVIRRATAVGLRPSNASATSFINNATVAMIVPANMTARGFQTSNKEPAYMVTTEPLLDPKEIHLTFLPIQIKQEIYQKHKTSPEEWSIPALCRHYKASPDRIKAIIFLLRDREEGLKASGILDNYQEWMKIVSRVREVRENPPTNDEGKPSNESEFAIVAKENSKSETEVKEIFKKMEDHLLRVANEEFMEEQMKEAISELQEEGVDTSFRETPDHNASKFIDTYYPELFGDENFEQGKRDLLNRLRLETKAKVTSSHEYDRLMDDVITSSDSFTVGTQLPGDASAGKIGGFSRFKFAFRDLSEPPSQRKTYIRTRSGVLRHGTPLESVARSWSRKPRHVDMMLFRNKLAKFNDPDGDEAKLAELQESRKKRNKEIAAKVKK